MERVHAVDRRPPGLYPRLLHADWAALAPAVQAAHAPGVVLRGVGTLRVRHGRGWLLRWLPRLARVPAATAGAGVRVTVERCGDAEVWHRVFGGQPLVTYQEAAPGGVLVERIGPLEFRFRLAASAGALVYRQVGAALCVGPLHVGPLHVGAARAGPVRLGPVRVPVPRPLAIQIACREAPADGPDLTRVLVVVRGPRGCLLFAYDGTVRWSQGGGTGC